jgi:MFS family permease
VASYFPSGERGPIVGLFNGAFSVGGAAGLVLGALIGVRLGWPLALSLGGAGLLVAAGLNHLFLPRERGPFVPRPLPEVTRATLGVLRSRSIWALALALTGFWSALYIVAQDFTEYAGHVHPSWGLPTASAVVGLFVVISLPGGPLGGWMGERRGDRRRWLAAFVAIDAVMVLILPFAGLTELWALMTVLGVFDGMAFAILYLIPTYLQETQGKGLALGVAFVNSVQVLVGSAVAVLFGFVVTYYGFTVGWLMVGGFALATLPLLLRVAPSRGAGEPRSSTG